MTDDKSKLPPIVQATVAVASTYREEFLPAAQQVGKALDTVGRAINVALSPVLATVWVGEQITAFVADNVTKKLAKTPPEQIVRPRTSVVAPALDAVRFRAEEPDIQELYANLIATSMDARVANRVFPSFVDILKQMTPDEAKILRLFTMGRPYPVVHIVRIEHENGAATSEWTMNSNLSTLSFEAGCEYPTLIQTYLDNFERLGLIKPFEVGRHYVGSEVYTAAETHPDFLELKAKQESPPRFTASFRRSGFNVTSLGWDFIRACVEPYERHNEVVMDE